ncbi:hypothetical protein A4A49_61515, partial [Nicotiana attenuata]
CLILLPIFVSAGKGNSNLAPMEIERVVAEENGREVIDTVLDYHYRCASNLGPCNDTYCNQDCCVRECRSYYSGLRPEPRCNEFSGYEYKFCMCWHDCFP